MDKIKLLVVEDNILDRRLLEEHLKDAQNVQFVIEFAERFLTARNLLNTQNFDAVVLDLGLPDSYGIETFYKVRDVKPNIPIVIVSGNNNEEIAQQAVKDGAHDYIVKGRFDSTILIRSIKYAIRRQAAREHINSRLKVTEKASKTLQKSNTFIQESKKVVSEERASTETSDSELMESYENLLLKILSNKLEKDSDCLQSISNFAQRLFDSGETPKRLNELALKQQVLRADSELSLKLNADLGSRLIKLLFEQKKLSKKGVRA